MYIASETYAQLYLADLYLLENFLNTLDGQ